MSKILVVDDSALSRQCVAKLLEQSGHTAQTAANGKEAWAMLYAGVPDLIVLDLMMPQMDGLTFLRLLRHNHFWSETPVIVLTGHADEEHMLDQAREMGVSDVIFKGTSAIESLMNHVNGLGVNRVRRQTANSRMRRMSVA